MPVTAADLAVLSRLLDEALDLDPCAQASWLARLPQEVAHLRETLQVLLSQQTSDSGDVGFMHSLPKLAAGQVPADQSVACPGDQIGVYRLVRELASGGMGTVWLAMRSDAVMQRQVALKLPRLVWGTGLAERMAREREIGSLLEHPGITRLYDAGIDQHGRPYLAFEYVDGQALDTWCAVRKLPVRDRVELFLQVARAVAYAHARLVIHRDLKPSNVLVSADGQVHLLDFGIAKLVRDAGMAETRLTQLFGNAMTPVYASPEQLRGDPVTIASDVYSLGVMLYELLCGRRPHNPKRATLAALEEAILEGEPALASSRVAERASARALRGELDSVLAKALRRQPEQRYATVDAMAQDLERHLAGERVLAQPDSVWYRMRKVLWRHRWGFAVSGSFASLVVAAAAISFVQGQRANEAAERANVVKNFVLDIFRVNARDSPSNAALRQLPVESLLERGAALIDTNFARQPSLRAELQGVVSGIFFDMTSYQRAAQSARQEALALRAAGAADVLLSQSTMRLARALARQEKLADAETEARLALRLAQGDEPWAIRARLLLCEMLALRARWPEAQAELAGLENDLRHAGMENTTEHAQMLVRRADVLAKTGLRSMALPLYSRGVAIAAAATGPLSQTVIDMRLELWRTLREHGETARAESELQTALEAMRTLGGPADVKAALAEAEAAWFSRLTLGTDKAIAILKRCRSTLLDAPSHVPTAAVAWVEFYLAQVHAFEGDHRSAYRLMRNSVPELLNLVENPTLRRSVWLMAAVIAMNAGYNAEAQDAYFKVRELMQQHRPRDVPQVDIKIAENLIDQGAYDQAEAILARLETPPDPDPAVDMDPEFRGKSLKWYWARLKIGREDWAGAVELLSGEPPKGMMNGWWGILKGQALCGAGRPLQGQTLVEAANPPDAQLSFPDNPSVALLYAFRGQCALAAGDRARALAYAAKARAIFEAQPDVSLGFRRDLYVLERMLKAPRDRSGRSGSK